MGLQLAIDQQCRLQGPAPVFPGYHRLLALADRREEGAELLLEGVHGRIDLVLDRDPGSTVGALGPAPEDADPALQEIDRGAGILAEKSASCVRF